MLGKAGLGTKFHVDRTQAENVALSVIDKPKVHRDPYILMSCACTCQSGCFDMYRAFNLADGNFASSILPLLQVVHVARCSYSLLNVNDVFTGEVKGNKKWEPDSFCACKVVVCAPTSGTKIC